MGGEGPIPFVAIDAYAKRYRIDHPDDFQGFLMIVRALDRAYLVETRPKPDA